jgi:hypothetical protein
MLKAFASSIIIGASASAIVAAPNEALLRDANRCANAWNRGDYPLFVSFLTDRVVTDTATRDSTLNSINDSFSHMDSVGLKTLHVSLGKIDTPRKYGDLYASILPIAAVLEGSGQRVAAQSAILAVSQNGESWRFLPLYKVPQQSLDKSFPEFERRLLIPVFPPPVTSAMVPNQSTDPTLASGTPPAGQESRHR